jgi:hypothetical protein
LSEGYTALTGAKVSEDEWLDTITARMAKVFEVANYAKSQVALTGTIQSSVNNYTNLLNDSVSELIANNNLMNSPLITPSRHEGEAIFSDLIAFYDEFKLDNTLKTIKAELTPSNADELSKWVKSKLDAGHRKFVKDISDHLKDVKSININSLPGCISELSYLYTKKPKNNMVYGSAGSVKNVSAEVLKLNSYYAREYFDWKLSSDRISLANAENQKKLYFANESQEDMERNKSNINKYLGTLKPTAKAILKNAEPLVKEMTKVLGERFIYGENFCAQVEHLYTKTTPFMPTTPNDSEQFLPIFTENMVEESYSPLAKN